MQSSLHDRLHVGVIMDGNGRWATRRGLPRQLGHRAGVRAAQRLVEAAMEAGVGALTLYAFSADNWRRPGAETEGLMRLLRDFLREQTGRLVGRGARLSVIGRRDRLPADLVDAIVAAEAATVGGETAHLRLAVDYSAREAILRAAATARAPEDLTRDGFARRLSGVASAGDLDLLIRTGGERRLSDFLLWESAYAELYFCDRLWPDFTAADLAEALTWHHSRERRFGALADAATA